MPCSHAGSTPITYSLSSYNGGAVPSWVSINSNTGLLSITAPDVTTDSTSSFYISSTISGYSNPVQKLIKLTVQNCLASNCQLCTSSSSSSWETCSSGYTLSSGSWSVTTYTSTTTANVSKVSQTATNLNTGVQYIIGFTTLVVIVSNVANSSSFACLWMMINQVQLFFLLPLTRAFIPDDVLEVINGSKFIVNPFTKIPFENYGIYKSSFSNFNFKLDNSNLEALEIVSNSSIYNIRSFIVANVFIGLMHFLIYLIHKWASKWRNNGRWSGVFRIIKYIFQKSLNFLTFGYYIRAILELNQFILISTINEFYYFKASDYLEIISFWIGLFIFLLCIHLIFVTLYLSLSSYETKEDVHNKLGEFFDGVKMQRKHKLSTSMLLIRRIILVLALITSVSASPTVIIGFLIFIQLCYLVYICISRSQTEIRWNIIMIINEVYMFSLLVSLIFLQTESSWSSQTTSIYIWIIASNSMIICLIVFCKNLF